MGQLNSFLFKFRVRYSVAYRWLSLYDEPVASGLQGVQHLIARWLLDLFLLEVLTSSKLKSTWKFSRSNCVSSFANTSIACLCKVFSCAFACACALTKISLNDHRLHAKEIFKATTNHTYVQQKGKLSPSQPVARRHSIIAVRDNVSLILNIIIFFDNTNLTKKHCIIIVMNLRMPIHVTTVNNFLKFVG